MGPKDMIASARFNPTSIRLTFCCIVVPPVIVRTTICLLWIRHAWHGVHLLQRLLILAEQRLDALELAFDGRAIVRASREIKQQSCHSLSINHKAAMPDLDQRI